MNNINVNLNIYDGDGNEDAISKHSRISLKNMDKSLNETILRYSHSTDGIRSRLIQSKKLTICNQSRGISEAAEATIVANN